jgi:hypothetical protein
MGGGTVGSFIVGDGQNYCMSTTAFDIAGNSHINSDQGIFVFDPFGLLVVYANGQTPYGASMLYDQR